MIGGTCGAVLLAAGIFIVRAQINPFGQPTNFKAATVSACEIDLSWDAQDAASFEIQRSTDGTFFSGVTTTSTSGTATSFEDTLLPASATFYYQMRAKDSNGQSSAWSDPASTSTFELNAPGAPTLASGMGVSGNKQISLSFSLPAALSSYGGIFVERALAGSNAFTVLNPTNPLPPTFTSYGDNNGGANLDPAKAYQYRIRSFESGKGCGDVKAYSPYSKIVIVPTAPSNLSVSYTYNPTTADAVNLAWNGSKSQDFYEVWRSVNSDAAFAAYASSTSAQFTDKNVQTNTKYFYEVRACSTSGGCSDFSNVDSRTVASAPQHLTASIAAVYTGTPRTVDVKLSWDNTFPERNYYLERATSTLGPFVQIGNPVSGPISSVTSVSYLDQGLVRGGTYVYQVRSRFGTNYTNYSNIASVDTNVTPLAGWAWAMADSPHGIGWIKFDSKTAPADTVAYGVYKNAGNVLSGYAWSGIKCATGEGRPATGTGSTCGYGWLSFNETSGCPGGGNCSATFDSAKNKLSGWAKFLAADPTKGGWDGWVSLNSMNRSEPIAYAVEYDPTTGKFTPGTTTSTSWAWGSTVTGWMTFYDVAMGAPNVELKLTGRAGSNGTVILNWTNPVQFGGLRLFMVEEKNPQNPVCKLAQDALETCLSGNNRNRDMCGSETSALDTCKTDNFKEYYPSNPLPLDQGLQSSTVSNLKPGAVYSFFLRTR